MSFYKNFIKLNSSIKFDKPTNKVIIIDNTISKCKLYIKLLGEYNIKNQPKIYFKSNISLDINIENNNIIKSNILIKNISLKNKQEYHNLYNILNNSDEKILNSTNSLDITFTNIYINNINKLLSSNIILFIESDAFKIYNNLDKLEIILDVSQYNSGIIFPNIKMIIKIKYYDNFTNTSSTSNIKSYKSNIYMKNLIISFTSFFLILFLSNKLKNNENNNSKINN